mmetsp:Transcript_2622/g.5503  ORF Transcript_2622/g.5503 Transcript_2622/m.5503 type:complete len:212 (-) Transcript_2622:60-695(-)
MDISSNINGFSIRSIPPDFSSKAAQVDSGQMFVFSFSTWPARWLSSTPIAPINSGRSWSCCSASSMFWYLSHNSGPSLRSIQTCCNRSALHLFRSKPSSNMRSGRSLISCPSSSLFIYACQVSGMSASHSIFSWSAPAGIRTAARMDVIATAAKMRAVMPKATFRSVPPTFMLKTEGSSPAAAEAAAIAVPSGSERASDRRKASSKKDDDA